MTFGAIKNRVRTLLGEANANTAFITDAELNYFLDDGIQDMCSRGRVFLATESLTLANGTANYSVNANYIDTLTILKATDDPNAPRAALDRISPEQSARVYYTSGRPDYFYVVESTIWFVDTPDANHAAKAYSHIYYAQANLYSNDAASPQFKTVWHPVLVDYVLAQAALKYKLMEIALGAWGRYNQRLGIPAAQVPPLGGG
jgi:hypothetical protein